MDNVRDPVGFTVSDVTGLRRVRFDRVDGHRPAGDIAALVASQLDLPQNIPWSLRDERHARMLEHDAPFGGQVEPDADLVVIPQSHLG
jgi:hypothetical protein